MGANHGSSARKELGFAENGKKMRGSETVGRGCGIVYWSGAGDMRFGVVGAFSWVLAGNMAGEEPEWF